MIPMTPVEKNLIGIKQIREFIFTECGLLLNVQTISSYMKRKDSHFPDLRPKKRRHEGVIVIVRPEDIRRWIGEFIMMMSREDD